MADSFEVRLLGVDELKRELAKLPEKLRRQAIRQALRDAGRVIQRAARASAPVLEQATPYRNPGTVRRRIMVRNSKMARRQGDEGVFIGVKPLTKNDRKRYGYRGAKNPNDPYYWMWQEFGWKVRGKSGRTVPGKRFLTAAGQSAGPEAVATFMRQAVPRIQRILDKQA